MTTDNTIRSPKKLIEVTLPLDEINAACVREKAIRHGHPSTLHLWWARRPLAAARAVIFASMVNDPGYVNKEFRHGVNKEEAQRRREDLCNLIKELVKWENINNQELLERAHEIMMESWREICTYNKNHPQAKTLFNPEQLPGFHDPFAGGGALPLEAQRLGLESYASDLNPVPVLINKAMIEIPPRFRGIGSCGPLYIGESESLETSLNSRGLAIDIQRYGRWMLDEAKKRIGNLYPDVEITPEITAERPELSSLIGKKFPVMAWIWTRTVKSPNPLYANIEVPLTATFALSTKVGSEAYIEPIVDGKKYYFKVRSGKCPSALLNGTKGGTRGNFVCLLSGSPITNKYIKEQGQKGLIKERLMAVVLEGKKQKIYLSPTTSVNVIDKTNLQYKPTTEIVKDPSSAHPPLYGFSRMCDLFSGRQLLALTTFSDLISGESAETVIQKATKDAIKAGMPDDGVALRDGGKGARAYGEAIGLYLSFAIDKCADYWSTTCTWHNSGLKVRNTFGRQTIPMTWDYCETNPFSQSSGSWNNMVDWVSKAVAYLPEQGIGFASQSAAQVQYISKNKVVSTDPPYYDNVSYANLSDFFYVWLRKNTENIYPEICSTFTTPKQEELIADRIRHGSKLAAEKYFLAGMTDVMRRLCEEAHPAFPVTIFYAFKQSETKEDGYTTNKGWLTFLEAVILAGFQITGTWPLRTEMKNRSMSIGSNALASSIVLVCRRRSKDAESISRKQFQRELKERLSVALEEMTSGSNHSAIAPVDLSQAIIGPGMEVFSSYKQILDASGNVLSVAEALKMINNFLDEDAFDADTQFGLTWFKTHQWNAGDFGTADNLARAKGRSVADLASSGILTASKGVVQLIHWQKLPSDWDPEIDTHVSTWEACHHLIRALQIGGGIHAAASLLAKLTSISSDIQLFCSTMYTLCEREKWTEDSKLYNELSTTWPQIEEIAEELRQATPRQASLF